MLQASELLQKNMSTKQKQAIEQLSWELFTCAEAIYNEIFDTDEKAVYCKNKILEYMEKLAEVAEQKAASCKQSDILLKEIYRFFVNEIDEDKFKIVFMPYKADMWKSMESIWEVARADDDCEVKVVPMPYYDITNPQNISYHYEQSRFPENVKCIHYNQYYGINWCRDSGANTYMYCLPPELVYSGFDNSIHSIIKKAKLSEDYTKGKEISSEWFHIKVDLSNHIDRCHFWFLYSQGLQNRQLLFENNISNYRRH